MASRREQILTALAAALAGGPGGLVVHRQRAKPIDQEPTPAVVVYAIDESTEGKGDEWTPLVLCELKVRCECRTTGDPADQILDPIVTWTVQRVMLDQTLGGLTNSIHERSTEWDAVSSNKVLAAAAITFAVRYQRQRDDPENA